MRVVAIIAAHDEERLIGASLEHLFAQGVHAYLIDNGSTDDTVAHAELYLGKGLIGIETLSHEGTFSLRRQLERKEELAAELDADWFIHQDVDEFRVTRRRERLVEALAEADCGGFSAVNFLEFTFVPTQEAPDHDHEQFRSTMRWYYHFAPGPQHRLTAWKRGDVPVRLAWSGGHVVRFPGLVAAPVPLALCHYLCLSRAHAVRKFCDRRYDPSELAAGWHRWRASLTPDTLSFPSERELERYVSDERLDRSCPREHHLLGGHAAVRRPSRMATGPSPPQSGALRRGP